jgi:carboxymethylenebutenolidase
MSAAIVTDSRGLQAGDTKVPVQGREVPAYYARPAGDGAWPLILVVQEIFGVQDHIKDVCRRLAKEGYFAVATELYARQGNVLGMSDIDEIRKIVGRVPDEQVMSDLDATVAWAKATGHADATHLAITGFCWGGRIVWLYAAHRPDLRAGVAWYGRLAGEATELQPRHPVDVAADLKAPVLGLYAGQDAGIPLDTVEAMKAKLQAAGKASEFVVYPEAPHAFHADYRPSYREEAAKDGWARCLAWLERHVRS